MTDGVHVSHCCFRHGCKYGDDTCPVVKGDLHQEYLCESCQDARGDSYYCDVKTGRHYRGDKPFWRRIEDLPEPQRGIIHSLACRLRELEDTVLDEIELIENMSDQEASEDPRDHCPSCQHERDGCLWHDSEEWRNSPEGKPFCD